MSAVVKLQGHETWHIYDAGTQTYYPFSFSPLQVQGFSEYQAVYSHFKLLKMVLTIDRPHSDTETDQLAKLIKYAVVPSRTFAASQAPFSSITSSPLAYVPGQKYEALGQTKWYKERLVSETRQGIRIGFYPYTMVGTFGPTSVGNAGVYQRVWNARQWMPFCWAWQDPDHPEQGLGTTFWGPYLIPDGGVHKEPWYSVNAQFTMYVKFKGQK